jgi:hypothetical protein
LAFGPGLVAINDRLVGIRGISIPTYLGIDGTSSSSLTTSPTVVVKGERGDVIQDVAIVVVVVRGERGDVGDDVAR